jgi:hypothetical protein
MANTINRNFKLGPRLESCPVLIAVHLTESPQITNGAKNYQTKINRDLNFNKSTHVVVDNKNTINLIDEENIAFDTESPYLQELSLSIALVGSNGYDLAIKTDWTTEYSLAVLNNAAKQIALWCVKYSIPPVKMNSTLIQRAMTTTDIDFLIKDNNIGIFGHSDFLTEHPGAVPEGLDPGEDFPWINFIELIKQNVLTN